jgi:hypothetical protein
MNLRYEILNKRASKIHLHDLILIFKCLYPHRQIINPFEVQIYNQSDWTEVQKELVSQLIYVSVLFNQKYRRIDQYFNLEAIEEDYVNALALAERELNPKQPKVLLSNGVRRFLVELLSVYGGDSFTLRQARFATHTSRTGAYWNMKELESKDLVRCLSGNSGSGFVYELTEKAFL